ncbi:MAG: ribosome silencing factor [Crocinitomicaceae bacterium]
MSKEIQDNDSQLLSETIVEGMQENKAKDIVVLDLREIESSVCDFFVICTGDSSTQVDGISNAIVRHTRKTLSEKPWAMEGQKNSEWILMDYVSVVAHVFYHETRAFYDLEDLWADAKRTDIPNLN